MYTIVEQATLLTVKLDLSDLAAFALEVRTRFVFAVCVHHSKLVKVVGAGPGDGENSLKLVMTTKNWNRVKSVIAAEEQTADSGHMMVQMSKKQLALQTSLGSVLQHLEGCSPSGSARKHPERLAAFPRFEH